MPPSLLGLGLGLGGSLINSLGNKLGRTDQAIGGQIGGQTADVMRQGLGVMPQTTQASMFSAAGQTGANVQRTFQQQLDQLGQSAGAVRTASELRGRGEQAVSGASGLNELARQQQAMAMGSRRRGLLGLAGAGGASGSALRALSSNMGANSAQGALALQAQGAQNMNQAQNVASRNAMGAQNVLSQDLQQRNQLFVDPFKAQVNASAVSPFTQAVGGLGSGMQTTINNPLSGLGQGLGVLAGGQLGRSVEGVAQ